MAEKLEKWGIGDFSGGLNSRLDPHSIGPNKKGAKAESPDMENMDIIDGGAIITSPGYELVSQAGSGTGGVKTMQYYNRDKDNPLFVIAFDDDIYHTSPTSASNWGALGDYGDVATNVGMVVYKGSGTTAYTIIGNDNAANTTKEDTGSALNNVGGTPPDGHILSTFMGRLFSAGDPNALYTLSYTNVDTEDDWAGGGTIGFNDIITGLKVEGERLYTFWQTGSQGVFFSYDNSFNLSVALKEPFIRDGGCYTGRTITGSHNKTYYHGPQGVLTIGTDTEYANNNSLVDSLSWKIKPSLDNVNVNQVHLSTAEYFERQYWLALPIGGDTHNSEVFIYNLDYDAWTRRTNLFIGDFGIGPDAQGIDRLFFGHGLAPELHKFNTKYSYNGSGYKRSWKSKIFNFGSNINKKLVRYVDLTGSMFENTEFKVIITSDGESVTFLVDKTSLITTSGGYLGDEYLGDQYLGGDEGENPFKRFYHRIYLPDTIIEGHEFQVEFTNSAAGQPFKIDYFEWNYRFLHPQNLDDKFINNNITAI